MPGKERTHQATAARLFISHSWQVGASAYETLLQLMEDSVVPYIDLSLPPSQALELVRGRHLVEAEIASWRRSCEVLLAQSAQLNRKIRELEWRADAQRIGIELERERYRLRDLLRGEAKSTVGHALLIDLLGHLDRRAEGATEGIDKAKRELEQIIGERNKIQGRLTEIRKHMSSLEKRLGSDASPPYLEKSSRYLERLPDYAWAPTAGRVLGFERLIAVEIANRIHAADLVFVLATPFVEYRRWMQYEAQLAERLEKPIIGVQTSEQYLWREATRLCQEVIGLNAGDVHRILLAYSGANA